MSHVEPEGNQAGGFGQSPDPGIHTADSDPLGLLSSQISHFRIDSLVGQGGMGVVYRATDVNMRRPAALKFLLPGGMGSGSTIQRFKREATTASSLDHQNIATIYEIGEADGRLFIAMAFYEGESLKELLAKGPIQIDKVLKYACGICSGLDVAHRHGIVHRDIKPANVMVTREDEVKILDFGLAKAVDQSSITESSMTVGTAAYMSPEQARGENATPASDLWSFGATLYELLTRTQPFAGDHPLAVLYRICNEDPAPLNDVCPDCPPELARIVDKCLAKRAEDRPSSAREILSVLEGVHSARQIPPPPVPVGPKSRRELVLRGTAVGALLSILLLWQAFRPRPTFDVNARSSLVIFYSSMGDALSNGAEDSNDGLIRLILDWGGKQLDRRFDSLFVYPSDEVVGAGIVSMDAARSRLGATHMIHAVVLPSGRGGQLEMTLTETTRSREIESLNVDLGGLSGEQLAAGVLSGMVRLLGLPDSTDLESGLEEGGTAVPWALSYYTQGWSHLQRFTDPTELELSITLLKLATEADSGFARAHTLLSQAYYRLYESSPDTAAIGLAVAAARTAVGIAPGIAEGHVALGTALIEYGRLAEAKQEFERAIELDPRLAAAYAGRARVYWDEGQEDRALESIETAVAMRPGYWYLHERRGRFLHLLGRGPEAVAEFREVIRLNPNYAWGYNNLGAAYHRMQRLDSALVYYRQTLEEHPTAEKARMYSLMNQAGIWFGRDGFDSAAEYYEEALAIDTTALEVLDPLGDAYEQMGRHDQARDMWFRVLATARMALALNPSDTDAMEYVAEACAKLGDFDGARSALDSLGRMSSSISTHTTMATVLEIMGERDSALEHVRAALQNTWSFTSLKASPWLDDLRRAPQFIDMAATAGFWEER